MKGREDPVQITGKNAKRVLFGTINLRSGHRVCLARYHNKGVDFRSFLTQLRKTYRGWHIVMVTDSNPSHTAKLTEQLARHYGITIIWLPKRDPHSNPMDHLWRHAKGKRCANRPYVTIDEEVKSVIHYLLSLTNEEALRKSGILSKNFWLQ